MNNFRKYFKFVLIAAVLTWFFFGILLEKLKALNDNQQNLKENESCGRFPREEHITIDNVVWQVLETPNGFVKLLNAYLDTRQNQTVVRVNVNSVWINKSMIFCQFWFDEKSPPFVVQASDIIPTWDPALGPKVRVAYFIECPLKNNENLPISVSLTSKPCDKAENNLLILNPQPEGGKKKKFGVCAKQMIFEDRKFAIRFIEWVHLMRLLGAEKIHFSYDFLHPDFFEIVQYFESQGIVETWPYFNPSGIGNSIRRSYQGWQTQVNMVNDCFYRARNLYEFVALVDFDEVLMPFDENDMNWNDLMKRTNLSREKDYYVFENIRFPSLDVPLQKDIPEYMHILQHTQREVAYKRGKSVKSIFRTETVIFVRNHYAVKCAGPCQRYTFPISIAQNSHYRETGGSNYKEVLRNETMSDTTVWKFKDSLIKAVHETLRATRFKP